MTIVQCGARRSGNYLLWSIVNLLLDRRGTYEQFLASQGVEKDGVLFTHALPAEVDPPGIYVVRDGRDAVASILHFVVTPEYRHRYPDCTRTEVAQLLELEGFYERRVSHWREHVRSYLDDPRPTWHLVRYEELAGPEKPRVVRELGARIGVEVDEVTLDRVLTETSVDSARRRAPGHVHGGRSGGHGAMLDEERLRVFDALAGEELAALGYAR